MKTKFLSCLLKVMVLGFHCFVVTAQDCPKNIDFETGTFDGWTCYVGFLLEDGMDNVIRLSPTAQPAYNRHTMYSSLPGSGLDPYGNFPINCPNGSGHSIKLGNDVGGALAEGLSYEFTIPSDRNRFTINYNYAVVFQESPHLEHQQPRFEVEVRNLTRDQVISCSSFEFHPFGPLTPGFTIAANLVDGVPLWYKEWTSNSINLNGYAGETIRLFFKTADCTYFDHFGYAYIDVNTECNGEFTGAKYCPGDTVINFTAPPGYKNYAWYNNSFTQVLGTEQVLSLSPQLAAGVVIPVQVFPGYGYGCIDTFYARAFEIFPVVANAGPDRSLCNNDSVLIGVPGDPGLVYSWRPAQGLSGPAVSNPLANPIATTAYILTVSSNGGGCLDYDTVIVNASSVSDSLEVIGNLNYCAGNIDSPVVIVQPADSIQWFRDNVAINGANQPAYKPLQSGTYYAALYSQDGCTAMTEQKIVLVDQRKQGINYPIKYAVAGIPVTLEARNFGDIVLWKPPFNLSDPNTISPVFSGNADQSYIIGIKTNSGCTTVDTQQVKIISHPEIYVPTAFTPNQDGLNDILRPALVGMKEFHYFKIFNRWGALLFETKNYSVGWDGKSGALAQSNQVVVWVAEAVGWDNKVYLKKGFSTIVK